MKKVELILLLMLFYNAAGYTQQPQNYIDCFFHRMENQNVNIALDSLFMTNKLLANDSDNNIKDIKSQLSNISTILGVYKGSEIIFYDNIGKSLSIFSYLVRYEKQPLRFTFIFYKAENEWELYNFHFDANVVDELFEKSKIYLLENIVNKIE